MIDFFQVISAKITAFITVVIITVTSILPWSATNTNKSVDTSTATPSATVSESASPSPSITPTPVPKVKTGVENKLTTESTLLPTLAPQTTSSTSPVLKSNIQPKIYSIIPISIMNIGAMEPHLQIIAQNAYQEFLRTPNLNQLDDSNQMEILVGIYARMLREEIAAAQQNLSQLKQENIPTPTPVLFQPNPGIVAKLDELRQTLSSIQNAPVAMNIIEGRKQRAYQDWMQNNVEIYTIISNSGYYSNILNSILRAYGL